MTMKTSISWIK